MTNLLHSMEPVIILNNFFYWVYITYVKLKIDFLS